MYRHPGSDRGGGSGQFVFSCFGGQFFAGYVFFPRAFVELHSGVLGDMSQVESEQAAFARCAAVNDDMFVGGQSGGLQHFQCLFSGAELVSVISFHEFGPMEADGSGNVPFSQPDIILADVFVIRSCVDQNDVWLRFQFQYLIDSESNFGFTLQGQSSGGIAEVLLNDWQSGLLPCRKSAIDDANV